MMFDSFVIPFVAGLALLLGILGWSFIRWIVMLPAEDKKKLVNGFFSYHTFTAIKEIVSESLLHRKIFRTNPLLGYMHMSLAFGWFLLIVVGNIMAEAYSDLPVAPPYLAIFFRFFAPGEPHFFFSTGFAIIMDVLLLFVLSGVLLAYLKRARSTLFGLKKTTRLKKYDRFALASLWLIFPLRFIAESLTSGVHHNGSFFTGTAGHLFAMLLPVELLEYPAWWAYSITLGIFFVSLPFSRFMHIPTEVLLIALRHYGIKTGKQYTSFSDVEVHSCSRCGICIDKCQLNGNLHIPDTQAVYFIRSVRQNKTEEKVLFNCLMCGRCSENCPVGIDAPAIRLAQRALQAPNQSTAYEYLKAQPHKKADVLFFAGCMTHLTPTIKKGMVKILQAANINFLFMDEDISACCGRPLVLAGQYEAAKKLFDHNKEIIYSSEAKTLITTCPICYKIFKEDYQLDIEVLHHTEYILRLMEQNKLVLEKKNIRFSYHDPCELGRGSGIYYEPRIILDTIGTLVNNTEEGSDSLCCGGSIANTQLTMKQRDTIRDNTLKQLTGHNPDMLITACPLCKKTFGKATDTHIADIAEIVSRSITTNIHKKNTLTAIPEISG